MTDPADTPDLPPPTAPPRKKGKPLVAWGVILVVIGLVLLRNAREHLQEAASSGAADEPRNQVLLEMTGRYDVAAGNIFPAIKGELYRQLETFNTGPLNDRLRFVVLTGELRGPDEALQQLDALRQQDTAGEVHGSPEDFALLDVLRRLYGDYEKKHPAAPSVTAAERAALRARLGWFGELALAPPDDPDSAERAAVLAPARRTMSIMLTTGLTMLILGMIGFVGVALFLILLLSGQLKSGLSPAEGYGGVYAETFAVWLVLFFALQVGASLLPWGGPRLLLGGAAFFLSLLALAWPVLRGVPWRQVRRDIGWTAGRAPALEPALGLATWVMAIPLLFVGALLTFGLIHVQKYLHGGGISERLSPTDMPTHPITQVVGTANGWVLLEILFLASVAAPVIEETMFRGVFYRYLREATGRAGRVASILGSGALVSFVFAVVHPQGWVAIPALMALAFAFCLMREWRGTLIPCMVAHGVHNGLLLLLLNTLLAEK